MGLPPLSTSRWLPVMSQVAAPGTIARICKRQINALLTAGKPAAPLSSRAGCGCGIVLCCILILCHRRFWIGASAVLIDRYQRRDIKWHPAKLEPEDVVLNRHNRILGPGIGPELALGLVMAIGKAG